MEGILLALVLFPMVGAFVVYCIGRQAEAVGSDVNNSKCQNWGNLRDVSAIVIGILEFLLICYGAFSLMGKDLMLPNVCGLGLHFTMDGFRGVYGMVAAFMWMMTLLFSKEYFSGEKHLGRYYLFQLLTLGATLGVFLSADLYTTFIFFEIMSFTSYVWVAQEETLGALRAAETYLAVAVMGGLVLLMGLFLLYGQLGTLEMSELLTAAETCENKKMLYVAGGCALFGFGAKAGAFPLHIWLPKAHPVAPSPASALLSGILTKSGIFGILVVSCNIFLHDAAWGLLLLSLGIVTMFLGALLAIFSVDLKRTLACSSMSQIGFILIGVGMQGILGEENALAVRGTMLHMVNHSLIKLVLFMIAGVVVMNLHSLNLNEIRGYGRKKPLLNFCFLAGAVGIAGVPLFNGYVSKTLLHESIVEGIALCGEEEILVAGLLSAQALTAFLKAAEWIFLISGGMTLAYMTKLYVALFVEKNSDTKKQQKFDADIHYMKPLSIIAIAGSALMLPIMGILPNQVMDGIADFGQGFMHLDGEVHQVSYFSLPNLKGALISILIGAVLYLCIRKCLMAEKQGSLEYKDAWPKWLDLENLLYRPILLKVMPFVCGILCRVLDSLVDGVILLLRKTVYRDRKLPHELVEGSEFTHILGMILDWGRRCRRRILRQPMPECEISYEHKLALQWEKIKETNTIIRRSLSFGLLLFYVGLVFTLIYVLYLRIG